jgi:hypothetical protein
MRPSSVKVSKVGLKMLPLSRLDPLLLEFPPFMLDVLEVVNSPAELPKCVHTRNEQEPEAPTRNLGKPDGLVCQTGLSYFIGTDGSQGCHQSSMRCSFSGQVGVWMVKRREPQQLWRLKRWLKDLIDDKRRKLEN